MTDNFVAPFSLDAAPVRGRIVRVGSALDSVLRRHDYPRPVAMLLGEALSLAALVGSLLKVEGQLVVQAQGEGPVSLLVAEHIDGGLRGYARFAGAIAESNRMTPAALLGSGALALTLDQGEGKAPYQGVVPLDGPTLAACAQNYFRDSEQTDTGIRLATGEFVAGDAPPMWRGGGVLMQRIAADSARGDTGEDWSRASHLFATVSDEELIDPALSSDRLLFRLFHQEGARMGELSPLADRCSCSETRLAQTLRQFPVRELRDLIEPDGFLHARCQFCARKYLIAPEEVSADSLAKPSGLDSCV